MRVRLRRYATAALAVFAACIALGGPVAGTATAEPIPFLALDCKQEIWALRGQPVQLARLAIGGHVQEAIRTTPGLGYLRSVSGGVAFQLGLAVRVGTVPDKDGTISGTQIADAVADAASTLGELAPARDAALARVRELVAPRCGITVHVLNGKAPEAPAPGKDDGKPSTGPNAEPVGGYTNPDQLWLYDPAKLTLDTGRAPRADYGSIPAVAPGLYAPSPATRYGAAVPGYNPQFGIIGANDPNADLRTVGEASALPVQSSAGIGLPVLLAVLALSVVTGTLVRTWVLRRA